MTQTCHKAVTINVLHIQLASHPLRYHQGIKGGMRWREVSEGVDGGAGGGGETGGRRERWVRDESTVLHYKISWWSPTVAYSQTPAKVRSTRLSVLFIWAPALLLSVFVFTFSIHRCVCLLSSWRLFFKKMFESWIYLLDVSVGSGRGVIFREMPSFFF